MPLRVFQLQQRRQADRYIHATAFVAHQFYRCQDNMIDLWLSVMASLKSAAAREYQERLMQGRTEQQRQIEIVVDGLEVSVFGVMRGIRGVMEATNLSDTEKVGAIGKLLDQSKTTDFEQLKDELTEIAKNASWYDVLEARSVKLQNRLSPVLRALNFMPNKRVSALLEAIDHFNADRDLSATHAPIGFLDAEQKEALIRADGTFRVSLYKVWAMEAAQTVGIRLCAERRSGELLKELERAVEPNPAGRN